MLNGRFELLGDPIGSGGFADVYRAVDHLEASRSDERAVVAIKVLRAVDDEEGRARFTRELRLLEDFDHPHVVSIIDSGTDHEGRPWYAMPLAIGSLTDELPTIGGADDHLQRVVDVAVQVGVGLAHLHDRGIWHRDLTPGNVLRTREGLWAISDFGLAREEKRQTPTLTSTVAHLGTFLYQAPEQMGDAKEAGPLADIYSFGKVLEAMIIGDHPIPGRRPLRGVLRPVVLKATRDQPHQRYQTVEEMLDDIRAVAQAPQETWVATDEALDGLRERLRNGDVGATRELLEVADQAAAAADGELLNDLSRVMPYMSREQIEVCWVEDPDQFRRVYSNFTDTIATSGYEFSFCDIIADFCRDVVSVTEDVDILRYTTNGLAGLGYGHNRWHVQGVLLALLQGIRATEMALAALDGLREARRSSLEWTMANFAVRSLHPILRDGIGALIDDGNADAVD